MSQNVVLTAPRRIRIEEVPDPPLHPGEVRVQTLYSGISAGTELAAYRGTSPFVDKTWDPRRKLFTDSQGSAAGYPIRNWGYEEVGEVVEIAPDVESVREGDVVFGTWGHTSNAVLREDYAAERILPGSLEPILGIFSHIGPIALNGVLDSNVHIGETVAVFGLGVVGQTVAQLVKGSGARVIGVDLLEQRLEMASRLGGIDEAVVVTSGTGSGDVGTPDAGERIKDLTEGRGVDVAIEVTGVPAALHQAVRATCYGGRVVSMGFHQGEARGLYLGEEFHHNRVELVSSQISGVAPTLSYRWGRLRLVRTTMRLQAEGVLDLKPLITHRWPVDQAAEAFARLDSAPADMMQVVLEFTGRPAGTEIDDQARSNQRR